MKKIMLFITAVMIFAATIPVKAGGVYDGPEPGKSIIGVRAGLDIGFMNVNAVYDYALAKVWKGTFTIGGYAGLGFGVWGTYSNGGWLYMPLMARTTYRFNVVVPQWEVYGGAMLGMGLFFHNGVTAGFAGGLLAGTSYYFTEHFGLNLEFIGGYGASYLNFGVKFKL
ncbi:MAG: hypothetical protein LBG17_00075 [Bacteroidales bacterium]|jgi:hypothetical protein|nr:hypothetical protein [Bacteroidales bacterium]